MKKDTLLILAYMILFAGCIMCCSCSSSRTATSETHADSLAVHVDSLFQHFDIVDTIKRHVVFNDTSYTEVITRRKVAETQQLKIDTANVSRNESKKTTKKEENKLEVVTHVLDLLHILTKIVVCIVIFGSIFIIGSILYRSKK